MMNELAYIIACRECGVNNDKVCQPCGHSVCTICITDNCSQCIATKRKSNANNFPPLNEDLNALKNVLVGLNKFNKNAVVDSLRSFDVCSAHPYMNKYIVCGTCSSAKQEFSCLICFAESHNGHIMVNSLKPLVNGKPTSTANVNTQHQPGSSSQSVIHSWTENEEDERPLWDVKSDSQMTENQKQLDALAPSAKSNSTSSRKRPLSKTERENADQKDFPSKKSVKEAAAVPRARRSSADQKVASQVMAVVPDQSDDDTSDEAEAEEVETVRRGFTRARVNEAVTLGTIPRNAAQTVVSRKQYNTVTTSKHSSLPVTASSFDSEEEEPIHLRQDFMQCWDALSVYNEQKGDFNVPPSYKTAALKGSKPIYLGRWLASIAMRAKKGGKGGLDDEQRGMLNLLMDMGLWPDRKRLMLSHEKEERENVQLVERAASRTTKSRGGGAVVNNNSTEGSGSSARQDDCGEKKPTESAASLVTDNTTSSTVASGTTTANSSTTATSPSVAFSFAHRKVLSPASASSYVPGAKPVFRPTPGGKQAVATEESVAALLKRQEKSRRSGDHVRHMLLGNVTGGGSGSSASQSSPPAVISPTRSVTK